MTKNTPENIKFEQLYKQYSAKVLATLIRLLGDFDLAEEAMHEAFLAAMEIWNIQGQPANASAWLISTGRFKGIDIIRRQSRLRNLEPDLEQLTYDIAENNLSLAEREIEDDQLRLIFMCCHPEIDPKIQIPLTLREVCGLTTEEIASAFLLSPATMAQRIVRGKSKIRAAKIPFLLPECNELPERLDAVLSVIYLVFNEGYSASSGDSAVRTDLTSEAIRLARLVLSLLPDPEVMGLLALMLLHESRRDARTDAHGDIVLLEEQNRSLWNKSLIEHGTALLQQVLASRTFGFYSLQAAISAVHANAPTSADTDWHQISALYSVLLQVEPSAIVELNRAVSVAKRDGPLSGLAIVDAILSRGDLLDYHHSYAVRGELLRQAGHNTQAIDAFEHALGLAQQEPEKRLLLKKIAELKAKH